MQGLDRGLLGACAGERRRLTVPSGLAYGSEGAQSWSPPIPGQATIVYDVEILEVVSRGSRGAGRYAWESLEIYSAFEADVDEALVASEAHDEL